MKRILLLGLILTMIISTTSLTFAKESSIHVSLDKTNIVFSDAVPFVDENNRTLVPLGAIGEAMGLLVGWDSVSKTATFTKIYTLENTPAISEDSYVGKETVTFTIGSKTARMSAYFYSLDQVVQGADDMQYISDGWSNIQMDTAAVIKAGRTYAPVRYLADSFRFETKWNGLEKRVELQSSKALGEVGLTTVGIAFWEDYQGWAHLVAEGTKIKSVEIIAVLRDETPLDIRVISEVEKSAVVEYLSDISVDGNYVTAFVVDSALVLDRGYKYTFKLRITKTDGTVELVTYNKYLYYDGGQGGIILR